MLYAHRTLLSICAILGVTAVLGTARERGAEAEESVRVYAYARPQTPSLNAERPVRVVSEAAPTHTAIPESDALYLASPFAATGAAWNQIIELPKVAKLRMELPDGRRIDLQCPEGREAERCLDAVRQALGLGRPDAELTAEAKPPSGP